jgi:hypothetical protein
MKGAEDENKYGKMFSNFEYTLFSNVAIAILRVLLVLKYFYFTHTNPLLQSCSHDTHHTA